MKRRRLVALGGLTTLIGLSGCSDVYGRLSGAPETPEGVTVDTQSCGDGVISAEGREEPFALVASSTDEAMDGLWMGQTNREEYDPAEFIRQTDFEESYLVMVRWCCSSSGDSLALGRIEHQDYGVHIVADIVDADGLAPNDMSPHALFIRITDERKETPERATVHVDG
jgi:hypothetical protein